MLALWVLSHHRVFTSSDGPSLEDRCDALARDAAFVAQVRFHTLLNACTQPVKNPQRARESWTSATHLEHRSHVSVEERLNESYSPTPRLANWDSSQRIRC